MPSKVRKKNRAAVAVQVVPEYRSNWSPFAKIGTGFRDNRSTITAANRLVTIARIAKGMK